MDEEIKIRKVKYNKDGTIDCEINHPVFGWIPFTATSYDTEEHGQEIFRLLTERKPND